VTLWLCIQFQPGEEAVWGFSSLAGADSSSPCAAQMLGAMLHADAAELLGLALPLRKCAYSQCAYSQSPRRKEITEAEAQQLRVVWSSGRSAVRHFA